LILNDNDNDSADDDLLVGVLLNNEILNVALVYAAGLCWCRLGKNFFLLFVFHAAVYLYFSSHEYCIWCVSLFWTTCHELCV